MGSKPQTACETVKTDKFLRTSYQNSYRSDTVMISGTYRGFAAFKISGGAYLRLRSKGNRNPNRKKPENHIGYQIQKPIGVFYEYRKRKTATCNEHQNRKNSDQGSMLPSLLYSLAVM